MAKSLTELKKLFSEIGSENIIQFLEYFITSLEKKQEQRSIEFVEPPRNKYLKPNLVERDCEELESNEKVTSKRRSIKLFYDCENKNFYTYIRDKKIIFQLGLSNEDLNKLKFKYQNHSFLLCSADIVYSDTLKAFSLHYLKIFIHKEVLKTYISLLQGLSLQERINLILSMIGLNPDMLLFQEKIIAIERLIPLVVKKHLTLDISKKEIGKTHTYSSLGFTPYTLLLTRANAFIDGRNGKTGDFFTEHIAFIIDELTKIADPDIITALQTYMNGNKYIGNIQTTGNNIIETDTSVVILGNIKVKTDLSFIFLDQKNIFENTIIMSSADGEAFVSRINGLLNSWGCRTFSPFMKTNTVEENFYNFSLLREVIGELREKELDIKNFYSLLNIDWISPSNRAHESVEKNLEGFLKIVFPEFLEGITLKEIKKYENECLFLYERAVEMRKTVDNQLKIINPSDNKQDTFPALHSELKSILFNIKEPHIITPHRIIIDLGRSIKKIPLDTIGIEQNKAEIELIKDYGGSEADYDFDETLGMLEHDEFYTYRNLKKEYRRGNYWSEDLDYNYLTGECEETNISSLDIFIFYDLEINKR